MLPDPYICFAAIGTGAPLPDAPIPDAPIPDAPLPDTRQGNF